MIIEARDVVKAYGPTQALRGISVGVREGEIVAVTGPSGCGKSTLLHILAGILSPDAGAVHYGGRRIDERNESQRSVMRRTDFGVLFQFGQLVTDLSAVENVALPLLLGGARRRAATEAAMEWLDRLGVVELADRLPGEMSGGQQQRVALGRAMVTEPKVLFADEPTGALDTLASEAVLQHMVRAARTRRTTVVLVTHDATVAAYADREIQMRDGAVEADDCPLSGTGASLLSTGAAETSR
ncbi:MULTISPECIES: ABC transporter ATP-binding protein [Streptomyces]|uniref:Putative ABC transport system ATP-binding protein n=1 Tax=Streptomyces melanosporofaciens TaxID=67327 RepID=A0A1H4KER6_STRMJ|nr:ABC transporter ATP-binding protein [Streptomyces melanosporofaciens]SEB56558.1 putative ABC transport system ATP-binding protein [Streptomyces melanosporofaciens]